MLASRQHLQTGKFRRRAVMSCKRLYVQSNIQTIKRRKQRVCENERFAFRATVTWQSVRDEQSKQKFYLNQQLDIHLKEIGQNNR